MLYDRKNFCRFSERRFTRKNKINTVGSIRDIQLKEIDLIEGKQVLLDDEDEFRIVGVLKYSHHEKIWVAEINWNDFNHH